MKCIIYLVMLLLTAQVSNSETWNLIFRDQIPDTAIGVNKIISNANGKVFFISEKIRNYGSDKYLFELENGLIKNLSLIEPPDIPFRSRLNDLSFDQYGNLLIATEFGLLKWDGLKWERFTIKDEFENFREILKIVPFKDKIYLLAESITINEADTNSLGSTITWIDSTWLDILVYDGSNLSLIHHLSPNNWWERFYDMWIDIDGTMWFTSIDKKYGGLFKLDNNVILEFDLIQNIGFDDIIEPKNIFGDENYIYVAINEAKIIEGAETKKLSIIAVLDKAGNLIKTVKCPRVNLNNSGVFAKISKIGNRIYIGDNQEGIFYLDNFEPHVIEYKNDVVDNIPKELLKNSATNVYDFDYSGGTLYLATTVGIIYGKLDTTSTHVNIQNSSKFDISPNPVNDFITIQFSNKELQLFAEGDKVQIFDVLGIEIMSVGTGLDLSTQLIDVSHLPAGVYFIRFGNKMEKFVKM